MLRSSIIETTCNFSAPDCNYNYYYVCVIIYYIHVYVFHCLSSNDLKSHHFAISFLEICMQMSFFAIFSLAILSVYHNLPFPLCILQVNMYMYMYNKWIKNWRYYRDDDKSFKTRFHEVCITYVMSDRYILFIKCVPKGVIKCSKGVIKCSKCPEGEHFIDNTYCTQLDMT